MKSIFSALILTLIFSLPSLADNSKQTFANPRCLCEKSSNGWFYVYLYDHNNKRQGNFTGAHSNYAHCLEALISLQRNGQCPR